VAEAVAIKRINGKSENTHAETKTKEIF